MEEFYSNNLQPIFNFSRQNSVFKDILCDEEDQLIFNIKSSGLDQSFMPQEAKFNQYHQLSDESFSMNEFNQIISPIRLPDNFFEPEQSKEIEININKKPQLKVSPDYQKNILRYLARMMIRHFTIDKFNDKIYELAHNDEILVKEAKEFYLAQIEFINGHRAFVEIFQSYQEDPESLKVIKKLFRSFCKWFLKEKAIRFIVRGNMKDKLKYIQFKNNVMLRYFNEPEKWSGNRNKGKMRWNKQKNIQKKN